MPLSLAKGVSAASLPTLFMRASFSDRSDKGLSGLDKLAVGGKNLLFVSGPRRYGGLCKRRFRAVAKLESASHASGTKNRLVKADLDTLVLDRGSNDAQTSTDPTTSINWQKIEVVGKDIDLDEEMSLLRKKAKNRKKHWYSKMKLEAFQSQVAQDTGTIGNLLTKEVKVRLEGDTSNLAESANSFHEELSTVLRENSLNSTDNEMIDSDTELCDVTGSTVATVGLVPYKDQWPTSFAALPGGGQLVADLTTAWDGLAGKLSPSLTTGKHMQQILSALKLMVAALYRAPQEGRTMLVHSLSISYTLADLQVDPSVMAAGLLRLVVEAGLVAISVVDQQLGHEVSHLLHDCMRFKRTLDQMDLFDEESARAVRQFCISYHDIRAIAIEFSVRLQQMRHVHDLPRHQQQILALEALQVHAPLAHAIGSKHVSSELEESAFKVLLPESYGSLSTWLLTQWPDAKVVLEECKQKLTNALEQNKKLNTLIDSFNISGRLKSRFSIMKKVLKDGRRPEEVYDVIGLRVVISSKTTDNGIAVMERGRDACYRVLEIVRSLWKEVPGRLKNYIENPKSNGYESLHVAVYLAGLDSKKPVMEVQIRTLAMDLKANDGDASHSSYKGGLTDPSQIQQLKELMMAAADRAAFSLKEWTGEAPLTDMQASKDQVFLLFDKNNDGKISMSEFQQVMDDLGVDQNEAHELMQLVDTNKDGSVTPDEFAEFKKRVSFLNGFDRRFSNKLGWTLKGSNLENVRDGDTSGRQNAGGGNYCFSSDDDNVSEPEFYPSVSDNGAHRSYGSELVLPQSPRVRWQRQNEITNRTVQIAPLTSVASGSPLVSELSSSLNVINRITREITTSRTNVDVRSNASSAVLKKPVTLNTLVEENSFSDSQKHERTYAVGDDSSAFDLTTGLQALRKLVSNKNTELARDLAKQLYERYPRNTDILVEYAYVERQHGDLVAAGALFSQAISAFEAQRNRGYNYIRALQALGSIEAHARNARRARVLFMESIHAARQAERCSPEMSGAGVYGLHAWARLEEHLGNWSKAQELLTRAAAIQPGNAVIHQSRALVEAKAHNWAAARHHFKLAVKAAPMDVKCWHAWALFEAAQRRPQRMRKLFKRALEVDPANVHSLQAWAHQETLLGTKESKETARSLFQRCIQIKPRNLYSWQAWACMEKGSGNFDKARELFEESLEINSTSVVCLQAFANMERNLGNLDTAQKLLRRALRVEPENAAALMEAALVERALGNHNLADKLFVLAGMADKRKSRVRNKIFHSRKEVMPWKAGRWKREMIGKIKG